MVRLFVPSNETDKVIKHYSKFQRMAVRAGILQSLREHRYFLSISEKNREKGNLRRKIEKRNRRIRRANKNRFLG
jgi:ribosomal protein S21